MGAKHGTARRALVAGGGTAGHVFPGLALGAELQRRGWTVGWLGRGAGMERSLAEGHGLSYFPVAARPLLGKGLRHQLSAALVMFFSAIAARRLVRRERATVVVGTGGYVSVPAVVGAVLARRPVLLLEPNARAGSANRWLSRLAAAACIGYGETAAELRCRTVLTGVPVRAAFFSEAPPGPEPSVLVVGGSQGALQINQLAPGVVERLMARFSDIRIVHQTGRDHAEAVRAGYEKRGIGDETVTVTEFIDDMAAAMHAAWLVVSRAGALTVAEIAASGRPSVLVPLAAAAGHQRANADLLSRCGAAVVIDSEVTEAALAGSVADLLVDAARRKEMGRAGRRLARSDAVAAIADVVEDLGRSA